LLACLLDERSACMCCTSITEGAPTPDGRRPSTIHARATHSKVPSHTIQKNAVLSPERRPRVLSILTTNHPALGLRRLSADTHVCPSTV
jgi:hypothetical protein